MPLGLVSYGSSDSEESDNESENETQEPPKQKVVAVHNVVDKGEISDEDEVTPFQNEVKQISEHSNQIENGEISDEEEIIPSVLDDNDISEDIPGLSSSTSLFNSLPSISTSVAPSTSKDFVDENEDLSTIPEAKIYSEKPDLKAIKPKKKKGPIRIMAPSLNGIDDGDDEKDARPVVRAPSTKKSGLFGMLPPPKNSLQTASATSLSVSAPSTSKPSTNSLMVPRSVSKKPLIENKRLPPPISRNHGNDSDDEEVPFFTMDAAAKMKDKDIASIKMNVKANPEALHPRGIEPGSHPSHQFRYDEDKASEYSEVTAPYPPPPPEPRSANGTGQMQPSQEALQRLAGAASKRRKVEEEGFNQIIDLNFDDIKPDEREWLTKALTEDDADAPGPKNTIKGERKTKHQITWLAAEAKQNENKLKKQWAENASNKRATGNKYGF